MVKVMLPHQFFHGKFNLSIAIGSSCLPVIPVHDNQGEKPELHCRKEDLVELANKTLGILDFPIWYLKEAYVSPRVEAFKINFFDHLSEMAEVLKLFQKKKICCEPSHPLQYYFVQLSGNSGYVDINYICESWSCSAWRKESSAETV